MIGLNWHDKKPPIFGVTLFALNAKLTYFYLMGIWNQTFAYKTTNLGTKRGWYEMSRVRNELYSYRSDP